MEQLVAFGSKDYGLFWALLVVARGMDFLSTWMATPHLLLEANPIARALGWRWGAVVNLAVCTLFAFWPLPAIVISTTSVLVAARNFQSAWLMRVMGEYDYRQWMAEHFARTPLGLYLFCLLAQTMLTAAVGVALVMFSEWLLVPFGIGVGLVTYAVAVLIYTALAVWRLRRQLRANPE